MYICIYIHIQRRVGPYEGLANGIPEPGFPLFMFVSNPGLLALVFFRLGTSFGCRFRKHRIPDKHVAGLLESLHGISFDDRIPRKPWRNKAVSRRLVEGLQAIFVLRYQISCVEFRPWLT